MSFTNKTALVIGYGSIGKRHAEVLSSLGVNVIVKSSQLNLPFTTVKTIEDALKTYSPDYVVICSITSEHYPQLCELISLGYRGILLIEKPIFAFCDHIPEHKISSIYVAYNLRFHPLIKFFKNYVSNNKVLCVDIYVGQYLPLWRPGRDYTQSYCVNRDKGGGVLRDLSHEIDYLTWIFGMPSALTAVGGKYSTLGIDSEDIYTILFKFDTCPIASLRMNYLDRNPTRTIHILSDRESVEINLIQGCVKVNDSVTNITTDRDASYTDQHIAALNDDGDILCDDEQAQITLSIINIIEEASSQQKWMKI